VRALRATQPGCDLPFTILEGKRRDRREEGQAGGYLKIPSYPSIWISPSISDSFYHIPPIHTQNLQLHISIYLSTLNPFHHHHPSCLATTMYVYDLPPSSASSSPLASYAFTSHPQANPPSLELLIRLRQPGQRQLRFRQPRQRLLRLRQPRRPGRLRRRQPRRPGRPRRRQPRW
jgi:hypothetical protein